MQTHDLIQGSGDWRAYRATHFNASDAPAMLGVSPYKTRTELLHERHTGMTREIDATTQARFDDGHRYEVLARALAEEMVGQDFYPVTGSCGEFSASFDGLTLDESIVWEHKSLNKEIRATKCAADLAGHLRVQMEQQLLVSGAERCLFTASKWDDHGELVEAIHHWYEPDMALRDRIIAGWAQFKIDLTNFAPKDIAEKPKAESIMQLPALAIQIRGEVTLSNLPAFKAAAEQFIANIKTDLQTDSDFSDAEATVKYCAETEKKLELAKASAIAQTASIDELMRTIDHIQAQLRDKRLMLDKLVKSQKEVIKTGILNAAQVAYTAHIASLESEIKPIRLACERPDFAGAMKAKRTLASLHDAVDGELANARIAADTAAKDVRAKLAWFKEFAKGYEALFADLQAIVYKSEDDFDLLVETRIQSHKKAEETKLEAERARIAEEERIKAEAKARADESARVAAEVKAQLERQAAEKAAREKEEFEAHRKSFELEKAADARLSADSPVMQRQMERAHEKPSISAVAPIQTPTSAPTLTLGKIGARLGFSVTADFLRSIGFEPVDRARAAVLYHEGSFPLICAALMHHIAKVRDGQQQAA